MYLLELHPPTSAGKRQTPPPSEKFTMYLVPIYHVIVGCSKWQFSDENRSTQGQLYWYVIRENIEGVIAPNSQHFLSGLGGAGIITFFFTEHGFFIFCH
jgi:hypothetical protein